MIPIPSAFVNPLPRVVRDFSKRWCEAASLAESGLNAMRDATNEFAAAVQLLEFCEAHNKSTQSVVSPAKEWMSMAAHCGVLAIYNFRHEMLTANAQVNIDAKMGSLVNREQLKACHRSFEVAFPDFTQARHTVAHRGEIGKSRSSLDKNSFSTVEPVEMFGVYMENVQNMNIENSLLGRTYSATWDGKLVTCDLTTETLQSLLRIADHFYVAFAGVFNFVNMNHSAFSKDS